MADDKLAQKRNTGPDPVTAEPNHDREKTYVAPEVPKAVADEADKLPERTAEDKVESDLPRAVDNVKKRL